MSDEGAGLRTNRKAIYSVVFGAAAFPLALVIPFLGFVLAVPSVTCGVHARREISASNGDEDGDLIAIIGLTFGATTLGLLILSFFLSPLLTG